MRYLIPLSLLTILSACHTHRQTTAENHTAIDSVAVSKRLKTQMTVDSLLRLTDASFDTLHITVHRPGESVKLTAVNPRFSRSDTRVTTNRADIVRLDSVAHHEDIVRSADITSDSVKAFDPPDLNRFLPYAVIALAFGFLLAKLRK